MQRILRAIIPFFCLWHMAAVSLYLLPGDLVHQPLRALHDTFRPFIVPYILMTSQWQQWDIFSPNPQRMVSSFAIERRTNTGWTALVSLDPDTLPSWMRVKELKLLSRLNDDWKAMAPSYLLAWCRQSGIPNQTDIRLINQSYVIPLPIEVRRAGGWSQWHPNYTHTVLATVTCSSSSDDAQ